MIYLSAAQRIVVSDLIAQKGEQAAEEAWHGEHALFRLWYVWIVVAPALPIQALLTLNCQASLRPPQFLIFILVGCDERLGL